MLIVYCNGTVYILNYRVTVIKKGAGQYNNDVVYFINAATEHCQCCIIE